MVQFLNEPLGLHIDDLTRFLDFLPTAESVRVTGRLQIVDVIQKRIVIDPRDHWIEVSRRSPIEDKD